MQDAGAYKFMFEQHIITLQHTAKDTHLLLKDVDNLISNLRDLLQSEKLI